ncbi:MAG: peptide ABC transporter substrate-binding protein [Pyrinomonadaceae bacterium]
MTKHSRWYRDKLYRWRGPLAVAVTLSLVLVSSGCFESEDGALYYGQVRVPRRQEFRWSDGGLPQTFDPAIAAAPPDTDAVRALFEGLTDYDPQTLAPVAGVAARWESSADKRIWTFYLRRDARWSNGAPVTAQDFVRSWQRTLRLGDRAPHANLLANIVGSASAVSAPRTPTPSVSTATPPPAQEQASGNRPPQSTQTANNTAPPVPASEAGQHEASQSAEAKLSFGVEAVDELTLRVRLQLPDKNFPALVAHPVFRPVPAADSEANENDQAQAKQPQTQAAPAELPSPVITNGAFQLVKQTSDNVVLERAQNYWNAGAVALERVRFMNLRDTEAALAAYRAGEVDAVTNASVEPLAVKLLASYKDFHRETFGALTYYEFNTARPPFDDLRIRTALALAIDRTRLSTDTLDSATEPADKFLPAPAADEQQQQSGSDDKARSDDKETVAKVGYDVARAQRLLADAGYAGGAGFPRIRLLVNRNEQHRAVAQAIAAMWRAALGVETEIIQKSWDDYEATLRLGDYDVARRSIVMQTTDEETNMRAMFAPVEPSAQNNVAAGMATTPIEQTTGGPNTTAHAESPKPPVPPKILTEQEALRVLPAMPVYFASSYALVKPYVNGFDTNLLDVPSLQRVHIDTSWQPPPPSTSTLTNVFHR